MKLPRWFVEYFDIGGRGPSGRTYHATPEPIAIAMGGRRRRLIGVAAFVAYVVLPLWAMLS